MQRKFQYIYGKLELKNAGKNKKKLMEGRYSEDCAVNIYDKGIMIVSTKLTSIIRYKDIVDILTEKGKEGCMIITKDNKTFSFNENIKEKIEKHIAYGLQINPD